MTYLTEDSERFFKFWRERYEWPEGISRKASEKRIFELLNQTRSALLSGESDFIQQVLVNIHNWKTNNRSGVSERYKKELKKDRNVVSFLRENLPLELSKLEPEFYKKLLETLKLRYCNLPACSAQASFLLDRRLPVLDRFIAQFFSLIISENVLSYDQFDMNNVLSDIHPITFIIEDDGTGKCRPRLAVYQQWSYKTNKSLFVDQLIPQLIRISKLLDEEEIDYVDIFGESQNFSCIDVEMAVFAFSTTNRKFFKCFYNKSPTRLNLRARKD